MNTNHDEKDTIELSETQAEWLVQKLNEDTPINPKMQEALRLYKEVSSNSDISKSLRR